MKPLLRLAIILVVMLIFNLSSSLAEVAIIEGKMCLSAPGAPWEICFPKENWQLSKTTENQGGTYCLFWNDADKINVSFFLEKAVKCSGSDSCREFYWGKLKATNPNVREDRRFGVNGFSALSYTVPMSREAAQYHYSAHLVQDGFWADVHLSKFPGNSADEGKFSGFINALVIKKRIRGT